MATQATDHRRAVAERNVAAILDATERLLREQRTPTMAAIAAAAGVSRVTLYAHFGSLGEVVEAAVGRAVEAVTAAIVAADVTSGPADAALERLIDSAWAALERHDDLARAATELVPPERLQRMHAPHLGVVRELFERGRRDGAFRDDLPLEWLVQVFYSLLHAAADHARLHGADRDAVRAHLAATLRAVVAPA